MSARLWLYQKPLQTNCSWFKWTRQKELETDPKAIQQMEFVGQLKKLVNSGNATDAGNDQSMFVIRILDKIK